MLRLADGTWPTTDQAPTIQPNFLHTTLATAAVIGSETQASGLRLPTTGPHPQPAVANQADVVAALRTLTRTNALAPL